MVLLLIWVCCLTYWTKGTNKLAKGSEFRLVNIYRHFRMRRNYLDYYLNNIEAIYKWFFYQLKEKPLELYTSFSEVYFCTKKQIKWNSFKSFAFNDNIMIVHWGISGQRLSNKMLFFKVTFNFIFVTHQQWCRLTASFYLFILFCSLALALWKLSFM